MKTVVQRYFDAFNAGDTAAMLDCLTDDVEHHVNQGGVRHGKAAFAEFCDHMSRCYRETLTDLVIFTSPAPCGAMISRAVEQQRVSDGVVTDVVTDVVSDSRPQTAAWWQRCATHPC